MSFEVRRGETVGIVGRNGSGKSTLLQVVCGTLRPNAGSVAVNGRIAALLELGAGFNPEFTGRENVYLNAAILGLSREETDARFDDIARFADIGDFIGQPVKTYSSGMYVRLAFATAINVDPDILVVDEALSVGDEAFQRKCFARIEQIQERGGTILFVTHSAQLVVQLCSRALLMDRGELIMDGKPKAVVSNYQKLLNLSGTEAAVRRAAILATKQPGNEPYANALATGTVGRPDSPSAPGCGGDSNEDFDPCLVSKSAVAYVQQGASIHNLGITTPSGRRVNILRSGRRYVLDYRVDFHSDSTDVIFGMQVKTMSGVVLGGANTSHRREMQVRRAKSGDQLIVRFDFQCVFLPGVYAIDVGALGQVDGDVRFLHRILDATVFRVAPEANTLNFGHIGIDAKLTIRADGASTAPSCPTDVDESAQGI
ncbi:MULTISPECIES: ABC transporter ATP-binding protein [Rhodoplanes]|uniref:ABC transporter ATP-binding protein n=1 Tax=Rhodoplanes TaxID=29407 RepID=UPI001FCF1DB7|nr:ABC transporter ATP-binding protein [Rhodoplanes serenus]